MKELLRTTDPITISFATALLQGEDIQVFAMDVHMSTLEGGIGVLPRRLLVHPDDLPLAQQAMRDNGIPITEK